MQVVRGSILRVAVALPLTCLPFSAALAPVLAVGCSALVQFHDQPACDGGSCEDASDERAGPSTGDASDDGAASRASDAAPRPDHYAPCAALASGYYCADDGPDAFAGPPSDLLYCSDGGIAQATVCDGGCLHTPAPFPDACNPCPEVPNGLYCGRQLAGFPSENADFLIQCQSGDSVQIVACPHGCGSNGAMSACYSG